MYLYINMALLIFMENNYAWQSVKLTYLYTPISWRTGHSPQIYPSALNIFIVREDVLPIFLCVIKYLYFVEFCLVLFELIIRTHLHSLLFFCCCAVCSVLQDNKSFRSTQFSAWLCLAPVSKSLSSFMFQKHIVTYLCSRCNLSRRVQLQLHTEQAGKRLYCKSSVLH